MKDLNAGQTSVSLERMTQLILEMSTSNAPQIDVYRAVQHSLAVINVMDLAVRLEKAMVERERSFVSNGIEELFQKYLPKEPKIGGGA